MDQSEISDILTYLKGEGFPTAVVGWQARHDFKRKCSKYSYKGTELYYGGRQVLNKSDAIEVVQQIHEDLGHMRGKNLAAAIQKHYEIRRLRHICYSVGNECTECDNRAQHFRCDGPMVHPTQRQLDRICDLLEIPASLRRKEKHLVHTYVK